MQRHRLQAGQPRPVRRVELADLGGHRLVQPRGRLAGRRGQRDPRSRHAGSSACSTSSASSRATVVVLPVPGPPVKTVTACDSAISAASAVPRYPAEKVVRSRAIRPSAGLTESASRSAHTCSSSSQYRSRYSSGHRETQHRRVPSNGLARTAAIQPSASGHGRSWRAPTCAATSRRSTHTEPPRSARTTKATASATRSSALADEQPRQASEYPHAHIGEAPNTPASLKRSAAVHVSVRPLRSTPASRPVTRPRRPRIEQIRQRHDQHGRRLPAEHARTGARRRPACRPRTYPARTDTAPRPDGAPVRNPALATAKTGAAQRYTAAPAAGSPNAASPRPAARKAVVGCGVAETVGLVIHDQITLIRAGAAPRRSTRPDTPAATGHPNRSHQPIGVGPQRIIRRQMHAQQLADVGHRDPRSGAAQLASGQGDLEIQFPQPIPHPDLPQRHAPRQRAQRSVVHRHHRRGQLSGVDIDRPPRRVPPHLLLQLDGQVRAHRDRRSPSPRARGSRTSHPRACPPSGIRPRRRRPAP